MSLISQAMPEKSGVSKLQGTSGHPVHTLLNVDHPVEVEDWRVPASLCSFGMYSIYQGQTRGEYSTTTRRDANAAKISQRHASNVYKSSAL